MKIKKIIALSCLGFSFSVAHANEVLITVSKPMKVVYRVAQKYQNSQPILGEPQTVSINHSLTVPISLQDYDRVGLVIVAVNDLILPPNINEFDKPRQCSMTTNKDKGVGSLGLGITEHSLTCRTFGGVYG